jgi:hypothetical protein
MEAVVCKGRSYRWPFLFCPGSSFHSRLSLGGGTGNGAMISLRPSLIMEHHSVSNLNNLAREASPCSRDLLPARDEDTTHTVGGNCSQVDRDRRTERIEPRSYSPDASVDPTEARKGGAANVAQSLRETSRSPDAGPGRILWATRRPSEICSAS